MQNSLPLKSEEKDKQASSMKRKFEEFNALSNSSITRTVGRKIENDIYMYRRSSRNAKVKDELAKAD
jgi:hypothetical protein